jgi:hypothetical protein
MCRSSGDAMSFVFVIQKAPTLVCYRMYPSAALSPVVSLVLLVTASVDHRPPYLCCLVSLTQQSTWTLAMYSSYSTDV